MIDVDEAQARMLALASPLPSIERALADALGHYLAEPLLAKRTQPAADLSAMDGYAIRFADMPGPWRVVGESAAGRPFAGSVAAGEAVRIFTGAHVPQGADTILIQEDAARDGDALTLTGNGPVRLAEFVRAKGSDFANGDALMTAGTLLNAGSIALAAMAGHGVAPVGGRPKVAIISSGDELVPPGADCSDAQIPSSNDPMLAAMLAPLPCDVRMVGIISDDLAKLEAALRDCADCDVIVTSGGASVGDHDLVRQALINVGAEIDFWKVAMKPGKPLMAGRIGRTVVLGLPGNPSSAFVTAFLFLLPLVRYLADSIAPFPSPKTARMTCVHPAGSNRSEYLRSYVENGEITPFSGQDSGLAVPLSGANALLIHGQYGQPLRRYDEVQYLSLD